MNWRTGCGSLALLLALVGPVAAQEPVTLEPGQPAPARGVFLTEDLATKLIEQLRDGDTAKAIVETLKAALEAKEREVAQLREALAEKDDAIHKQEIALAKAEERDRLRAEVDAKLEQRVKELMELLKDERNARKWDRALGAIPIIGALLLLFGVGGL